APECGPEHPGLERAESSAELDSVVHVISLRHEGLAPLIFRHEREDAAQAFDIAYIEDAEIERHKQLFVWIDDDRIRFAPTLADPFIFRQNSKAAAISAINVQTHLFFAAKTSDFGNRIHARG